MRLIRRIIDQHFAVACRDLGISGAGEVPVSGGLEIGPSLRTAGNLNGTNPSHYGVTAGIGMALRARSLSIEPTVRYTRWATDGTALAKSAPDQADLLLAISSKPASEDGPEGPSLSMTS